MPTTLHPVLLLLHLVGAVAWVGGMFFAHFCLRPAALQTLEPARRLPLMEAALRRFFAFLAGAVPVVLVTGLAMFWQAGARQAPPGWHAMAGAGLLMAVVFAYVRLVLHPLLRRHCEAAAWPDAAKALDRIRHLVAVNLGLGLVALAGAAWGG